MAEAARTARRRREGAATTEEVGLVGRVLVALRHGLGIRRSDGVPAVGNGKSVYARHPKAPNSVCVPHPKDRLAVIVKHSGSQERWQAPPRLVPERMGSQDQLVAYGTAGAELLPVPAMLGPLTTGRLHTTRRAGIVAGTARIVGGRGRDVGENPSRHMGQTVRSD